MKYIKILSMTLLLTNMIIAHGNALKAQCYPEVPSEIADGMYGPQEFEKFLENGFKIEDQTDLYEIEYMCTYPDMWRIWKGNKCTSKTVDWKDIWGDGKAFDFSTEKLLNAMFPVEELRKLEFDSEWVGFLNLSKIEYSKNQTMLDSNSISNQPSFLYFNCDDPDLDKTKADYFNGITKKEQTYFIPKTQDSMLETPSLNPRLNNIEYGCIELVIIRDEDNLIIHQSQYRNRRKMEGKDFLDADYVNMTYCGVYSLSQHRWLIYGYENIGTKDSGLVGINWDFDNKKVYVESHSPGYDFSRPTIQILNMNDEQIINDAFNNIQPLISVE